MGAPSQVLLAGLLRASTIGARFVLLIAVARYLTPDAAGQFGLIAALVGYALFPLGLEFYAHSTRVVAAGGTLRRREVLSDQWWLSRLSYATFASPIALVIWTADVQGWLFVAVLLLCVSEHVAQEGHRLLVALEQQVAASEVLFVRLGSWVILLAPVLALFPAARSVHILLLAWLVASGTASVLAWRRINSLVGPWWRVPPDRNRVGAALRVVLPLLIATLAFRGLFVFDRYALDWLEGSSAVAPYVLAFGAVSTVLALQDATLLSFATPRLISAIATADWEQFQRLRRRLWRDSGVLVTGLLALAAVAWLAIVPTLPQEYHNTLDIAVSAGLVAVVASASMVPHVLLYAARRDRGVLTGNLVGLAVLVAGTTTFALIWSDRRALVVAMPIAVSAMLLVKWGLSRQIVPAGST